MSGVVAVTGASGFVGGHLVRRLVAEGYSVRALVRTATPSWLRSANGEISVVEGDILEPATLGPLVQGVSSVVHLAGRAEVGPSLSAPREVFMGHVEGTLNLLEAIRAAGTLPICLYLSTDRVYGKCLSAVAVETSPLDPLEPYAAGKLAAEHVCKVYSHLFGIAYVIFRCANIYGPGQRPGLLIPRVIEALVRKESRIETGSLRISRNFIFIDDVVDAFILVLQNQERVANRVLNIAGEAATLHHVLAVLLEHAEKILSHKPELVEDASRVRPAAVEPNAYSLDCSQAKEALGWQPRHHLVEGLELTLRLVLSEAYQS